MSNILAIAQQGAEGLLRLADRLHRASGFFALMFGFFFYSLLLFFDRQSMQMAGRRRPPVNVNEQLIRPVFLNATVIFLFVLPMVTMRTYSEEKRSGTIELLLTSPLTDLQIILGKFLGAMGLYAAMLARDAASTSALLFWLGNPEWLPVRDHLPRAAADGRLLHLGRAAHLEPDEEPDRRRHGHLRACS